jgi:hypothetical protein
MPLITAILSVYGNNLIGIFFLIIIGIPKRPEIDHPRKKRIPCTFSVMISKLLRQAPSISKMKNIPTQMMNKLFILNRFIPTILPVDISRMIVY